MVRLPWPYEPARARWLTVDPLVPGVSLFIYSDNNPLHHNDPSGMQIATVTPRADTAEFCVVQLACVRLVISGGPKHCGIEVQDVLGISRYHVDNTASRCDVVSERVIAPNTRETDYYKVATWKDFTGQLCKCIHKAARRIHAAALDYAWIPSNDVASLQGCRTISTCNSNCTTNCIMKSCGIAYKKWWLPPVGWNHRMKRCVSCCPRMEDESGEEAYCTKWVNNDLDWCADEPVFPKYRPADDDFPPF